MEAAEALLEIDRLNNIIASISKNYALNIPFPKPIDVRDGNIEENFNFFKIQWQNYLVASGMNNQSEDVKKSILLSAIGEDCLKQYQNFPLSDNDKSTADNLLAAIGKNLTPCVNIRFVRAIFNLASQDVDESNDVYVNRLRGLVKNCQYGDLEDDLLLDKLICSLKDLHLRESLWLDRDITLAKAVEKCSAKELTQRQLKEISADKNVDVYKVIQSKSDKIVIKLCKFCAKEHVMDKSKCPAYGAVCSKCKCKNHFAKVCKSKYKKKVNHVKAVDAENIDENISGESDTEQFCLKLYDDDKFLIVEMDICVNENRRLFDKAKCMLDTGATCNIIGVDRLYDVIPNPLVTKSSVILTSFGGSQMKSIGETSVLCRRDDNDFRLRFLIVEGNHMPLLSGKTCQRLGFIKVCAKIDNVQTNTNNIVKRYNDVFEGLGLLDGKVTLELNDDAKPVKQVPRRVPVAMIEHLKSAVNDMLKLGVVVPVEESTDWISNVLLVKRNGKMRLCLDPCALNKVLKCPKYQIPTLDECLPDLHNAKVFSTLDCKKGFWQLQLDDQSSRLTTFWTPFGRYRFVRMPFGLGPAMEIYQKKQHEVVQGLHGVLVIADDFLVFGRGDNIEEAAVDHDKNLEQLFIRLRNKNCKLNPEKVNLCASNVKFFGHVLTGDGISADPEKINAIQQIPNPKNVIELMRFLGMITYLSRFLPKLSEIAEPLRQLTHQNVDFVWNSLHNDVFVKLKHLVAKAPLLRYYDMHKPVVIQADASSYALGATIMQDGRPVSYASKMLTKCQRNYAQIEKELLAILFACRRFDQYICGRSDVCVETDHKPLIRIVSRNQLFDAPKRLQAMLLSLQRYNLKLKYVKGTEVIIADLLSRAIESDTTEKERHFEVYNVSSDFDYLNDINLVDGIRIHDVQIDKIKQATIRDPVLQKLRSLVINGWPENLKSVDHELRQFWNYRFDISTQNDLLVKSDRIIVPAVLRENFLQRLHANHQGMEYTIKLAKETVFWPKISDQIKQRIQACLICLKHSPKQQDPPMISHAVPDGPFQYVSMDVFEVNFGNRIRKYLVTVDHFSDFFEVDELSNVTSSLTIVVCKRNFSRHGIPITLVTDNGTNFASDEFRKFVVDWEIDHRFSSPHHQQANGKAESAVKIVKQLIKKSADGGADFYKSLLQLRNTPNKIGASPVERLYSRKTRCTIPVLPAKLKPKVCINVKKNIELHRSVAKKYYDRRSKIQQEIVPGDRVMVKVDPKSGVWQQGLVKEHIQPSSFIVSSADKQYRRSGVHVKPQPVADFDPNVVNDSNAVGIPNETGSLVNDTQLRRSTRQKNAPSKYNDYVLN